jgi:hypothetical protein
MTQPPGSPPTRPPKWVVLGFITAVVLMAAGLMLRVNTSHASRECAARYRAARTAADTAAVDTLVPQEGETPNLEAHSCRFIRKSAGWR